MKTGFTNSLDFCYCLQLTTVLLISGPHRNMRTIPPVVCGSCLNVDRVKCHVGLWEHRDRFTSIFELSQSHVVVEHCTGKLFNTIKHHINELAAASSWDHWKHDSGQKAAGTATDTRHSNSGRSGPFDCKKRLLSNNESWSRARNPACDCSRKVLNWLWLCAICC